VATGVQQEGSAVTSAVLRGGGRVFPFLVLCGSDALAQYCEAPVAFAVTLASYTVAACHERFFSYVQRVYCPHLKHKSHKVAQR